jgi:TRAP-type C4-dicarboxylate transport system permease small subunit
VQLLIAPLETVITLVLRVGRWIATAAIGIMVLIILTQVFFRYVLNNALPWPDEAARFLMLWLTGLMAPSAYRWGGFVAIDMVPEILPRRMGLILNLAILVVSLSVLLVALQLGIKHINSGWLFNSSSLKVPLHLIGGEAVRLKLAWMYMSIYVGFVGMAVVGVELILKNLHMLIDENADYGEVPDRQVLSAE